MNGDILSSFDIDRRGAEREREKEEGQYFHSGESKVFGKFQVRVGLALKIPEWSEERKEMLSSSVLFSSPPLIKEIEMAAIFIAREERKRSTAGCSGE